MDVIWRLNPDAQRAFGSLGKSALALMLPVASPVRPQRLASTAAVAGATSPLVPSWWSISSATSGTRLCEGTLVL